MNYLHPIAKEATPSNFTYFEETEKFLYDTLFLHAISLTHIEKSNFGAKMFIFQFRRLKFGMNYLHYIINTVKISNCIYFEKNQKFICETLFLPVISKIDCLKFILRPEQPIHQ